METKNIVLWLRGYAAGLKDRGEEYACAWINLAADRLDILADEGEYDQENVHPDWYERLSKLDYIYDPEKDGKPWYHAEQVWGCIEDVSGEHHEFGGTDGNT